MSNLNNTKVITKEMDKRLLSKTKIFRKPTNLEDIICGIVQGLVFSLNDRADSASLLITLQSNKRVFKTDAKPDTGAMISEITNSINIKVSSKDQR